MISVRPAVEDDINLLYTLDHIARREDERREFIRREVAAGDCFVAVIDETVVGYGVLNYTFYNNGCIDMLYIHSEYRRRGGSLTSNKLPPHRGCSLLRTSRIIGTFETIRRAST